jgi:L-amino acid N-acyltransferase YncA
VEGVGRHNFRISDKFITQEKSPSCEFFEKHQFQETGLMTDFSRLHMFGTMM